MRRAGRLFGSRGGGGMGVEAFRLVLNEIFSLFAMFQLYKGNAGQMGNLEVEEKATRGFVYSVTCRYQEKDGHINYKWMCGASGFR